MTRVGLTGRDAPGQPAASARATGSRVCLFSVQQGKILVLHGFIKKSQKTPAADLALARKRNREFEQ
jgi:phage-related protein